MSYEGYTEFLCANGHYQSRDCWGAHRHAVDQTNDVEDDNPDTMPAPKEQIGADDEWHVDRHGNKYAIAIPRYRPVAEWFPLSTT